MNDIKFCKVSKLSDLLDRMGRRFLFPSADNSADEVEIALFKVDDEVYALSNICPHQHTALIYEGFIENNCVVCPAHGWMFDLKTGNQLTDTTGLDAFPVKIENGDVYVAAYSKKYKW